MLGNREGKRKRREREKKGLTDMWSEKRYPHFRKRTQ
jgi:hypothetical protein